ncbi:hypothetical protein CK501_13480 [Halovibrio salipaludis]|uniref:Ricin B lectin domain-containing protein n=1 Tax=Halovibrio salipaludis TaxID=2032626 RepID=A0A2A2F2C0_9GAMM|nr:hypothetical protein [Halovibrio salipaludis]PAU78693.1 hypothetical protein CK501_13480 [Halovibrio salipaludis]
MRTRLFYPLLTLSALALTACGSGDPSVSDENSFDIGTPPDFRDGGSGLRCQGTSNLEDNQLLVSVQTPSNSPDAEKGSGLSTTTSADLSLVEVGSSWSQSLSTENVGEEFVVTFEDGVPRRIDLAIEASVAGSTYKAPVASECGHVFVNPFSDVLIDEVIQDLDDSAISEINSCNDVACTYDLVWQPVADRVQSFEIDVTEGQSALRDRADFMAFLRQAETLLTQEAATLSSGENEDIAPGYNAVQYGISLNSGDNTGFWATHTLDRGVSEANGTAYTYPRYSIGNLPLSELGFDLALGTVDIPLRRRSFHSTLDDAFRSYSTQANQLFAPQDDNGTQNNMLSSLRPILQTVSDEGTRTIGWAPNPHVYRAGALRDSNAPPQAMLSSYFLAARGWELSGTADTGYEREAILEQQAIASVELNLAEWDDGNEFSSNSEYQFAGFELKPAQSGSDKAARASIGDWQMGGNTGTENVDPGDTWSVGNGSMPEYADFDLESVTPKDTPNSNIDAFQGQLFLNYEKASQEGNSETDRIPNAAVSANERWIAASSRPASTNSHGGSLLRIAYKQDDSDTLPSGSSTYQVQGFSISSADALTQHENACLQLGSSSADYSFSGHRTSYESSSGNFTVAKQQLNSKNSCDLATDDGGETFSINNCTTDGLQIEGFAADNGNTLVMITRKSNESVGFLLGFRDDSAEGCPN